MNYRILETAPEVMSDVHAQQLSLLEGQLQETEGDPLARAMVLASHGRIQIEQRTERVRVLGSRVVEVDTDNPQDQLEGSDWR